MGGNQLGGQWTNGNQPQWGNNNGQQWGNQVPWGNNGNQVFQWGNNGLGQQGICSPNTINCGVTYQFLKCMNNLPRSVVSDRCFSQATTLADWFFTNSGLNCPFTQIRSQCNQYGMNPFVNPSQRPNMGFSTNNQFGFNG